MMEVDVCSGWAKGNMLLVVVLIGSWVWFWLYSRKSKKNLKSYGSKIDRFLAKLERVLVGGKK